MEYGGAAMQLALASRPSSRCSTVPQLFCDGEFLGGCSEALVLHAQGKLEPKLRQAAEKASLGGEAPLPSPVTEKETSSTERPRLRIQRSLSNEAF